MMNLYPVASRPESPPLRGVHQADVVIVGGGLSGVCTAAMLARTGWKVILLERRRLGDGSTQGCCGVATIQMGQAYQTMADRVNPECAQSFLRMLTEAQDALPAWLRTLHCPWQETDVYTYAFLRRDLPLLEAQLALAQRIHLPMQTAEDAGGCPFPVVLSGVVRRQIMLSPMDYLYRMADEAVSHGAVLAENTPAVSISAGSVYYEGGRIDAPSVLVTTGVPLHCGQPDVLALLEARMRTLCFLQGDLPLHTCHFSAREDGLGLRPVRGGLLTSWTLGRTGERHEERDELLDRVLAGRLPEYRLLKRFHRQELYPADGLPLIGSLRHRKAHLLMAAGFSGCGITGSYLAALLLTRLLMGQARPEDALLRPHRRLEGNRRVMLQGMKPMVKARLTGTWRLKAPLCPHMRCRLRYSHVTGRWECPCHGSTFSVLGEVVTGPAGCGIDVSARDRPIQ